MTCSFDLGHYRELLDAAIEGGYRFAGFERDPAPGDLLVRHDVDLSLDAALTMAELEAHAGARTTYLLMTRSVFYNLASREGERALDRLRALGHAVGLHAVHPHVDLDERFDPVVAWHNPEPPFMHEPIADAANPMASPWFSRDHYRSDSNQHWRSGCPHEALRRGELEWLQLLIHPEIWVYEGSTMRETMHSLLDAERERRVAQFADDKIDFS